MAFNKKKSDTPDQRSLMAFEAQLKTGTFGNLYVFHGEEAYLRDEYLRQIRQALLPDGAEAFNFKVLEGKDLDVPTILAAADCFPMMAQRTVVVVRDFDIFKCGEAQQKALLDYFADLPEYLCLIFVYDLIPYKADARTKLSAALKQHGMVVEFNRQDEKRLENWIARHFKATGHTIDAQTAKYLVFLCGDLMHNLASEIDKIGAYAKETRITKEDIDAVATPQLDAVVFQLTNCLSAKDYDGALATLADLLHMQQTPQMILGAIAKHFRRLYAARVALEERHSGDEMAALWGMKPGAAGHMMAEARRVTLPWCKSALRKIHQADRRSKSTGASDADVLTELVLSLAYD